MKSLVLTLFWIIPLVGFSQLTFEPVTAPNDFSIGHVRESPTGEYFLQSALPDSMLYTSSNGMDWISPKLAHLFDLNDLIFFEDGMPLLRGEGTDHFIRKNGIWETIELAPEEPPLQVRYYERDTLFGYQRQQFV